MSEENIEILRAFYEAFNRRLFDDALQYLHPECELYPAVPAPGEPRHYHGRTEAREFMVERIPDAWNAMTVEFKEEPIEAPDGRTLAVEQWRARGRDGIEIDTEVTDIYAFRDGLIARVDGFTDKGEALEAAGLWG
jgi:ketosteroid isomerase-like protein